MSDDHVRSYDETRTKQAIILKILDLLDWDVFSPAEVEPEHSVGNRRVDYSLNLAGRPRVFVEAKKPIEDLEKHEEQLLDYAFREGVDLAVLSNGVTWWLYLPTKPGPWTSRKFLSIDLQEQTPEVCTERLGQLLAKQTISDGTALQAAERYHSDLRKQSVLSQTLPEAWNKIVGEPDASLIELLTDTVERMCGYRPDSTLVSNYVLDVQDQILLDTEDEDEAVTETEHNAVSSTDRSSSQPGAQDRTHVGRETGSIRVRIDGKESSYRSIPKLYEGFLRMAVDSRKIDSLSLPYGFGSKRYFLFRGETPVHPTGRRFFAPVRYREYQLEAHVNRRSGVKYLQRLADKLGYRFEVINM